MNKLHIRTIKQLIKTKLTKFRIWKLLNKKTYLSFGGYTVVAWPTKPYRLIKSFVWQCRPEFRTVCAKYLTARAARALNKNKTYGKKRNVRIKITIEKSFQIFSNIPIDRHTNYIILPNFKLFSFVLYTLCMHKPAMVFPSAEPEFCLTAGALRDSMIGYPQYRTGQIRWAATATDTRWGATLLFDRFPWAYGRIFGVVDQGSLFKLLMVCV